MKTTRTVAFSETDASGRAHFTSILKWAEDAEHAALREMGVVLHDGGSGWPRVRVECDYRAPVMAGDEVQVRVSLEEKGRTSLTWLFLVTKDKTVVAEGRMVTVFMKDGTASPIPENLS